MDFIRGRKGKFFGSRNFHLDAEHGKKGLVFVDGVMR